MKIVPSTKIIFGILLFVSWVCSNIQSCSAQAFNDVNHTRITLSKYQDVEGTPFFLDEWMSGSVKMANGSEFKNLYLKYNQEDDQVYFKGKSDDEVLSFVEPIKEFTINISQNSSSNTAHFRNGYSDIAGTDINSYFEVLVDGKVQFLRRTKKEIEEHKEYGSSTLIKKIIKSQKYYILQNGKSTIAKLNNKAILLILNNVKADDYVVKNNLNLKTEEGVEKLLSYYNTI